MSGGLYLVGTPIGNLEDITLRALRTLRECDRIACEDTRHTRRLLNHFDIRKPLLSCHDHNEAERAAEIVERIAGGESIALVSDAGMPAVSDPGYRVVAAAVEADLPVVPIPGPTAVSAALVASGLPTDAFHFAGFLPPKKGQRLRALEELAEIPATVILYETPHRIVAALRDAAETLGDRPAAIGRELTKAHEEFLRGTLTELRKELERREAIKGEMVLLIGRADKGALAPDKPLPKRVRDLLAEGSPRMDAIKQAAREYGLSKREAYRLVEED